MAGTYCIIDPVPALRAAMGGAPMPAPLAVVPYDWDAADRNLFEITAEEKNAAYQRADIASPRLYTIKRGERLEAVALIPGNDGREWLLLTNGARVPRVGVSVAVKVG